jgi:hypothetical protein
LAGVMSEGGLSVEYGFEVVDSILEVLTHPVTLIVKEIIMIIANIFMIDNF